MIATDAWHPQINGVVRTYERVCREATELGVAFNFLTPEGFRTLPAPTYPEIHLALVGSSHVARRFAEFKPDFIHIATEGPIGLATRRYCIKHAHPFTTSYHTRFPEYLAARFPVRVSWGYSFERWFHRPAAGIMAATPSLTNELQARGFPKVMTWTRGVDTDFFRPRQARLFGSDEPVFIYVGRVAIEKNLEAFLDLKLPGKKVVVGGGPALELLARKFPNALFTGQKRGEDLAEHYASADVFVFPSLTDTFGIVLLEAMASGLPVAAFPVTGPNDVVVNGLTGVLDDDLQRAALAARRIDRGAARRHALQYSWRRCTELFIENMISANAEAGHRPLDERPAISV